MTVISIGGSIYHRVISFYIFTEASTTVVGTHYVKQADV